MTTTTRQFRKLMTDQRGTIDLASIMVGLLVMAIAGGALTATLLFAVPAAQDDEARAHLTAVRSALSVARIAGGEFLDGEGLAAAGRLQTDPSIQVNVDEDGVCYIAAVTSGSGRTFYATQYRAGAVARDVAETQCSTAVAG